MSLREIEGRSGVTRSTISRIERGLRRPRCSVLGWLAWGLDAENVTPLTRQLAEAAGDSLIAESRWSQRTHARHAERAEIFAAILKARRVDDDDQDPDPAA